MVNWTPICPEHPWTILYRHPSRDFYCQTCSQYTANRTGYVREPQFIHPDNISNWRRWSTVARRRWEEEREQQQNRQNIAQDAAFNNLRLNGQENNQQQDVETCANHWCNAIPAQNSQFCTHCTEKGWADEGYGLGADNNRV